MKYSVRFSESTHFPNLGLRITKCQKKNNTNFTVPSSKIQPQKTNLPTQSLQVFFLHKKLVTKIILGVTWLKILIGL